MDKADFELLGSRSFWMYEISGVVTDSRRSVEVLIHPNASNAFGAERIFPREIRSTTRERQVTRLLLADGREWFCDEMELDLPPQVGHKLSFVVVGRVDSDTGHYVAAQNHTTGVLCLRLPDQSLFADPNFNTGAVRGIYIGVASVAAVLVCLGCVARGRLPSDHTGVSAFLGLIGALLAAPLFLFARAGWSKKRRANALREELGRKVSQLLSGQAQQAK